MKLIKLISFKIFILLITNNVYKKEMCGVLFYAEYSESTSGINKAYRDFFKKDVKTADPRDDVKNEIDNMYESFELIKPSCIIFRFLFMSSENREKMIKLFLDHD